MFHAHVTRVSERSELTPCIILKVYKLLIHYIANTIALIVTLHKVKHTDFVDCHRCLHVTSFLIQYSYTHGSS